MHNVDADKAWISGLLLDCAKFDDDPVTFLIMAKEAGITPTPNQMTDPYILK